MVKNALGLFLLFMLFSFRASGAVGCRIGNIIYTNQYSGASANVVILSITYGNFQNNLTLPTNPPNCPRATNIVPVSALINLCVLNGNILNGGTMVNYERLDPPIGCPIDDYIWLLFGFSAYMFYKLRFRNLLNEQKERTL
ncbi:hypothetical protein [Pedobacter rhizosphaerae]|uniref:Uncharacterized protein n=1 Tax=Pedobacter rhizosphaerae TaxID=390241 RepID=A0A1H9N7X0_9SPHI|nr:hypothetical protein [Pedobacter rhizosphaerae]SER32086.1 hypothetical protein SAMN04488023_10796 [Pedobacter rhizosphaerae]